jgi:hypothetical protein
MSRYSHIYFPASSLTTDEATCFNFPQQVKIPPQNVGFKNTNNSMYNDLVLIHYLNQQNIEDDNIYLSYVSRCYSGDWYGL